MIFAAVDNDFRILAVLASLKSQCTVETCSVNEISYFISRICMVA
jgi:hypothetical protein